MLIFLLKSLLSLILLVLALFAMFTMFEVFGRTEKKMISKNLRSSTSSMVEFIFYSTSLLRISVSIL
jgi:hypothetical protein